MHIDGQRTGTVRLETKSSVPVHYTFTPGTDLTSSNKPTLLIVCLSGLGDPRKIWHPTVSAFSQLHPLVARPPILTFDRFGSGETGRDPSDAGKLASEWHDAREAAQDLRKMISQVCSAEMGITCLDKTWLVLVAHSMGTLIAQLYAQCFPGHGAGFLFLDSVPTDTDGTSWYPDPDAPGFDRASLPAGVTPEILCVTRKLHRASPWNPNSPNSEGLRWLNASTYLPTVGEPKFIGPVNGTPLLTMMMHDQETFAKQLKRTTGAPEILNLTYNSPAWRTYLNKLMNVVEPQLRRGIIIAKGSGHHIHLERPDMVARELDGMVHKLYKLIDASLCKL